MNANTSAVPTIRHCPTPQAIPTQAANQVQAAFKTTIVWLNGAPAGRIEIDGQLAAVSLVVDNGRVTRIYAVANPRKLTRLDEPAELAR